MTEKLWDRIQKIHEDHALDGRGLAAAQEQVKNWDRFAELENITRIEILRGLRATAGRRSAGLHPDMLARSVVVAPQVVMVDERIPGLCWHEYLRPDGSIRACGGVRNQRSACPGYGAPPPVETQNTLNQSAAVVVIQAHNLRHYDHQRQLHVTLVEIEKHIQSSGFELTASWSAGPCRICPDCLGEGNCRAPKLRRYSMEGSGMGVFLTCERIAQLTGDQQWSLSLIENWELSNQSSPIFKSVVAIGIGSDPLHGNL